MKLSLEPELQEWLARKGKNIFTIDVLISRGGCCGGCACTEAVINFGKPKDNLAKYLLFEEEGLKVHIARLLDKKTEHLTLYLKGSFFKRPALRGYEPDCSWKQKRTGGLSSAPYW